MAKVIKVDVTGVEEGGGGGSVDPKPGVYPAKLVRATHREQKSNGQPANDIECAFDLGGDFKWKYSYIGLGPESDWKLAEFVRALGLSDKVNMNLEKILGTMVRVKLNPDNYEGETTSKIGRIMKAAPDDELPEASDEPPAGDEPDADEPEADAAGGGASAGGGGGSGYPDGYEPDRETDDNSYDAWSDDDVEGEFTDRGLTAGGGRGKKRDKMIAALRADDEVPNVTEPEPAGDDDDDYETWETAQLIEEVSGSTGRGLDEPAKPRGSNAESRYRDALIALLREDDAANPFDPPDAA